MSHTTPITTSAQIQEKNTIGDRVCALDHRFADVHNHTHQNLPMFAELTGPRSTKNVILTTMMWDKLSFKFDDGTKQEKILKEEYWNIMIHLGTAIEHFLNESDLAWSILDNIVNPHKTDQEVALLFQEEV